MRLAVYTDYTYRRDADGASGERAFVRFMTALDPYVDRLVLVGRLDPTPGRSHYPIPADVGLVGLPYYSSLTQPVRVASSLLRSVKHLWRALDDVDTVWLLGPYVHALTFGALAALRGRRIALGVRQDTRVYHRTRHPGRRWIHMTGDVLEFLWRALARRYPVVVVGPGLARRYGDSPRLLEIAVSLVSADEIVEPASQDASPSGDGEVRVLTVGRLDLEKNPLLLADALAGLQGAGGSWRLVVCGDGPLREELEQRLAALGVSDRAELRGYVPIDAGLLDLYRSSDVFLHVSWTEGLPQVLFEAFAAALPVVATDVGGVAAAADGAALLIPAGDAGGAAEAVRRVVDDHGLRARLVAAGTARVRSHTLEAEASQVATFLAADQPPRLRARRWRSSRPPL